MSNTLYRKYRPQKFSDIIGQNHITQTLSNAITHQRIGHAYLFTGPRGTGKTSMARLFAKAINCTDSKKGEACLKCENCQNISQGKSLDVFEIDAASNTGVENIRELRETIKLPPSQAKYKVYIIDEVHMLSTGAFNALLKTLEEPPTHAVFILATTEIHKVPQTILSRCQRFDFGRISLENIIKKLSLIASSEKIEIEKEALEAIAIAAEGGMRDAESLLEQIISLEDKKITAQEVAEILGTTSNQAIEKFAQLVLEKKTKKSLELISSLSNDGFDLEVFHKAVLNHLRQLLLLSIDLDLARNFSFELTGEQLKKMQKTAQKNSTQEILAALNIFSELQGKIKTAFIPQLPLEMAIVKITQSINPVPTEPTTGGQKITVPIPSQAQSIEELSSPTQTKNIVSATSPENLQKIQPASDEISSNSEPQMSIAKVSFSQPQVEKIWPQACKQIIETNHSLAALLPLSMPQDVQDGYLTIVTRYGFYKDKLNENQNRLTVESVFGNLLGSKVKLRVLTEDESGVKVPLSSTSKVPSFGTKPAEISAEKKAPETEKQTSSLLEGAANLLGGQIVQE